MTSQDTQLRIDYRPMLESDLPAAHRLSQAVAWPYRPDDLHFLYRLGSGVVAEREGEVLGTALCWMYGENHASLGMVIVAAQAQGNGIGRALMTLLLETIGARSTLLNATAAGQPLYERLGFAPTGRIHQHQGIARECRLLALPAGERIRPIAADDAEALATLAELATGMPRRTVLQALLAVAEGIVIADDQGPIGFALLRRFGRGDVIGPVVAPDRSRAKALISHLVARRVGGFVRIDVPETSELGAYLEDLGLGLVEPVVTMVRGAPPQSDPRIHQFAVVSQAIG